MVDDFKFGEMDIDEQEKIWSGFMNVVKIGFVVIVIFSFVVFYLVYLFYYVQ